MRMRGAENNARYMDARKPLPIPERECCCPKDLPPGFTGINAGCKAHSIAAGDIPSCGDLDASENIGLVGVGGNKKYRMFWSSAMVSSRGKK